MFTDNLDLTEDQMTRQGFLSLNEMEAEQDDTEEEFWQTLTSMGFNHELVMDEVNDQNIHHLVKSILVYACALGADGLAALHCPLPFKLWRLLFIGWLNYKAPPPQAMWAADDWLVVLQGSSP